MALISGRALGHAKQLLDLIGTFPTLNPSIESGPTHNAPLARATSPASVDLPTLLGAIRARYRLLCSSLGIRPRLISAKDGQASLGIGTEDGAGEGVEGPMKGVDTKKLLF